MGLLSKFMNALGGEPSVSKPATQPVLRTAQQNVPKPTQQQTTQRKSTAQSRQAQQPTQPSQSSQLRDRHTARKHKPQLAILPSQRIVRERNLMPIHNRRRSLCRNRCFPPIRLSERGISSVKSKSMI